jgi:hypothetical protein
VEKDIGELARLLDNQVREQELHEFLAHHSYFFNGIIRLFGASPLYSKIKLGSEFEIDFACFDAGTPGPEWHLIEIEGPGDPLFNKAGDPTARLTHAIQQVSDWQRWIHEHLEYARNLLPHLEYPMGYVFIGRSHELTPTTRKRLRRLNYDHRSTLEIHSLDWFVSAARSVVDLVGRAGHGDWTLPMNALSHKDLAGGLPTLAQQYMVAFAQDPTSARDFQYFIRSRQWKYENSGGAEGEEVI